MEKHEMTSTESCQCLLHSCALRRLDGETVNGHEAIGNKIVLLLFTSNWCEPCHSFTRILKQAYNGAEKRHFDMIVVNVPIETEENEAAYGSENMPNSWFTIPFDSPYIKLMVNKFLIRTVPRLVVCKSDGSVLTHKGRNEVDTKHSLALLLWIEMAHAKPKQLVHGFDIEEEDHQKR